MPLPYPNLDDRSFDQLMEEARRHIAVSAPDWTDLSPGDPGIVLMEVFAYLTETMNYRLNRLPQKAYLAFLNLLGVTLQPPAAASVRLHFRRERAGDDAIEIPRATRVTTSRTASGGEAPVFVTAQTATIAAGETEVEVLAFHADQVEGELIGYGTGLPGLSLTVRHAPIIAPTGDELDLLLALESKAGDPRSQGPALQFNGKPFRIWQAVANFANLNPDDLAYVVDRTTGAITFAPAVRKVDGGKLAETAQALAAIPPNGREIRAWYRRGGGPAGNVGANTLTTLKDPIPG